MRLFTKCITVLVAVLLYTSPVMADNTITLSAKVDGIEVNDGVQMIENNKIGSTVRVNLMVDKGGYNNYTFFIKYNPNVLRAIRVTDPPNDWNYIVNNYSMANNWVVYDSYRANSGLSVLPAADNADYTDVNADGLTTCAELGKIKFGYYISGRYTASQGGILMSLEFEVIDSGTTDLELIVDDRVDGFRPLYGDEEITTLVDYTTVVVRGEAGDSNGDGIVNKKDAAFLLNFIMGNNTITDLAMLDSADCDGIEGIDIRDVIWTLNNSK